MCGLAGGSSRPRWRRHLVLSDALANSPTQSRRRQRISASEYPRTVNPLPSGMDQLLADARRRLVGGVVQAVGDLLDLLSELGDFAGGAPGFSSGRSNLLRGGGERLHTLR